MYDFNMIEHLAHERRKDLQHLRGEERLVTVAERLRPRKNWLWRFAPVRQMLRGSLLRSLGLAARQP